MASTCESTDPRTTRGSRHSRGVASEQPTGRGRTPGARLDVVPTVPASGSGQRTPTRTQVFDTATGRGERRGSDRVHAFRPTWLMHLTNAWHAVKRWNMRLRESRSLLTLDDRMLRDIGMTRTEAERIGRRPFWKS